VDELTKEERETSLASVIQAPKFYGSSWHVNVTSNEFSIMLGRPHFVLGEVESAPGEPVAILQMSPQAAKDLLVLLGSTMAAWEEEWGIVTTEYTRRKA